MSNSVTLRFRGDATDLRRTLVSLGEGFTNLEGGATLAAAGMAAITAAVGAAPMLIGAALAAAPLVFAGISAAAILSSKEVKKEFKSLKESVAADIREIAKPMQDEFINIFHRLKDEVSKLKPMLAEGFAKSAPLIDVLTTGILRLTENAMPGLLHAVGAAGPTMQAMSDGLARMGEAITYFFDQMAAHSDIGARGMTAFFDTVNWLIKALADLLVWLSTGATAFHAIHDAVMIVLPILLDLFVNLEKMLGPAFQALVPLVRDLAETVAAIFIPVMNALQGPLGRVAQALTTGLHPAFVMIQESMVRLNPTITKIAELLGDILVAALNVLTPLLANAIKFALGLVEAFAPFIPQLLQIVKDLLPPFGELLKKIQAGFQQLMTPLFQLVKDLLPIFISVLGEVTKTIVNEFLPLAIQVATNVLATMADVLRMVVGWFKEMIPPIMELVKSWLPVLKDLFQKTAKVFMEDIIPPLMQMAKDLWPVLVQTFKDLVPLLADLARQLIPLLASTLLEVAKSLFTDLLPALVKLVKDLLPLFVDILKALVPAIIELAQDVLPILVEIFRDVLMPILTDVVIPVFTELAKAVIPLLVSVLRDVFVPLLRDVVIPIVKYFVDGFRDYLVPFLRDVVVPLIVNKMIPNFKIMAQAVIDAAHAIIQALGGIRDDLRNNVDQMTRAWDRVAEWTTTVWNAMTDMRNKVIGKLKEIVNDIHNFPETVKQIFADARTWLVDAGANMLVGFIDGVKSQAQNAIDSVHGVVNNISGLFPHSPADWGPFSGAGYTFNSGVALLQDFARGAQSIDLKGVFEKILSGVSGMFSFQGSPGGGGTANANINGLGSIQLKVAPGADSALASLLMNMVRTGQLQLQRA